MAKLKGPLMSMEASGSIGGALTYANWKGQAYVRGLVIPVNRMSEDQGDNRMIVGGIGRAVSKVNVDSDYHLQMITLNKIPSGQSKQSALVKAIKTLYCADATAFEAIYTAFEAHAQKAAFTASAAEIGLADFNIEYKGTAHSFSKGMMLYLIAKYGCDMDFTGEPYATAIGSWDATETAALVADLALPA